jgi:hypothetical protein
LHPTLQEHTHRIFDPESWNRDMVFATWISKVATIKAGMVYKRAYAVV